MIISKTGRINTMSMLYAAITVGLSWALVILWLSVNLISPAIEFTNGGIVPLEATRGSTVEIQQDKKISREITYTISKELVRNIFDRTYSYALPDVTLTQAVGTYKQSRHWKIPSDILPGRYTIYSTACYTEFNVFQRCIKLAPMFITVLDTPVIDFSNKVGISNTKL